MRFAIVLVSILILFSPAFAQKRAITFNDLYAYPMVGDLQLSPDGKTIAYVVTEYDTISGESKSRIFIIEAKGSQARRLANQPDGASHPRWSPDGKSMAFVASQDRVAQAMLIDIKGGEARNITSLSTGVSGVEWSPDGKKLIFSSRVYPDCATDSCNQAEEKSRKERASSGMLFDHLPVRHYSSWDDGKVNHLFIHNLEENRTYDLTAGDFNAPPIALGGSPAYDISPDGKEACFEMNTDEELALSTNNDLFTVDINGGRRRLITENKANDTDPLYSPDGRYIAYLAMSRPGFESDKNDLMFYDRKSGKARKLTSDFQLSIGGLIWSNDSKTLFFSAIDKSWNSLFKISLKSGAIEKIITGAVRWEYKLSSDSKKIYYIKILPDLPGEIYSYDIKNRKEERLTFYAKELFNGLQLGKSEHFWFSGADGDSIHSLLTYPPKFDQSKKYPLVLLIHGGPQWAWLDEFNYYGWNKHLVAAQGYMVAQIDPHGSSGYGQKFLDSVSRDWGGKDYQDLMMGLDYLIAKYNFIDDSKMAAMGRSYGGFMVNWIAGHTDRFKCLVCVDGIYDQVSDYCSTDELWFPEWDIGGTPWENETEYRRLSPLTYADNFKTPILIEHGQRDYRVDLSQALGMFTVLQRKGIDSQLLYFPDESHGIHRMKNLEYFYQVQFEWLGKYLR
ncbi:MAG: S9 family peptidase [candidate division Zixibacteria bacterium CG_4_9_14_3_um_filter_46_8]|nr:MAG: S9 family peptidase [candidate division Zixibacteria bacterium CG_4_9_14_3_um_filter_46_8]